MAGTSFNAPRSKEKLIQRALRRCLLSMRLLFCTLFLPAGTLAYREAWTYLIVIRVWNERRKQPC